MDPVVHLYGVTTIGTSVRFPVNASVATFAVAATRTEAPDRL